MPTDLTGYKITKTLFNNERTAIHRAIREEDGQPVVLKQLVAEHPSPGQISRFSFGYEVLSKFNHTNIVKPIAWYSTGSNSAPTMVLEDKNGIDLFSFLSQFEPAVLPVDIFLNIAIQLAEALSVIHYNQVIHKDLHPGNIIVTPETGLAQITDFGLASLLSREQPTLDAPEQIEGVMAYISPEQTGRMNRALDYRTDFYTLGATFYHLLAGNPPFSAEDALGMVHAHIAKQQEPLAEVRSDVPPMLSAIIDKLLNKTAEERYQSALGLRKDLEKIRFAISADKPIPDFPLGMEDISDRFQVPQKLYGREEDVSLLMRRFFQAAGGKPRMLAVAGYSGIGKSALVHEIHKPIAAYNGLFCSGKFDQFQKNIPYSALQSALKGWIQYTLSFSEQRLKTRQQELLEVLGSNARVLIDFMPEFKMVLGDLPPVDELAADETQNRFHLVFQKFIQYITQSHPLVLFIDDIQWADRGTLNLLPILLSESGCRLLVIVAYRNNEVDENHPAVKTLQQIKTSPAIAGEISELELGPLNQHQVSELVKDALHRPESESRALAQLVFAKTAGNPFFIGEFLKSLYTENLLNFDLTQQRWGWDLDLIKERDITDNVVELMLTKMQKLPEETQSLIQLAACLGSRFDLDMLAKIAEQPLASVARRLWPALSDGLLIQDGGEWHLGLIQQNIEHAPFKSESDHVLSQTSPMSPQCRFLHDRMLQAAYQSMSEEKRQITHLRVGRLLLRYQELELDNDSCFAIAAQLNKARALISSNEEKEQLIQINLRAAQQAWRASVWEAVANYSEIGIEFLPNNHWQTKPEESKNLFVLKAESEYLSGNPDKADIVYNELFANVEDDIFRANICATRLNQSIGRGQWLNGLEHGKRGLQYLGLGFPEPDEIDAALKNEQLKLDEKAPSGIIQVDTLKEMQDEGSIIAVQIYSNLSLATLILEDFATTNYCNFKGTNLVIEGGKSDLAAMQLTCYSMYLHQAGKFELAYNQAEQAKKLTQQYTPCREIANCYNVISNTLWYLKSSFADSLAFAKQATIYGFELGEIARAAISQGNTLFIEISKGEPVSHILNEAKSVKTLLHKKSIFHPGPALVERYCNALLNGNNKSIDDLSDKALPSQLVDKINATMHFNLLLHLRAFLAFWCNDESRALEYSLAIGSAHDKILTHCFSKDHLFLLGLLLIRNPAEGKTNAAQLNSCLKQIEDLANLYPPNFEHKHLLLLAEKSRMQNEPLEQVFKLYRKAIESARQHGFIQYEALGCELYANYWLEKETNEFAELYLNEAISLYHRWGCAIKVKQLKLRHEKAFPRQDPISQHRATISKTQASDPKESLDMASVMKSAQAISSELQTKKLVTKVLQAIFECAGASYAALILSQNGEFRIQATVHSGHPIQLPETPPLLDDFEHLPVNILHLVLHSKQPVNIGDILTEQAFSNDKYLIKHQPRSVFCVPVLYREKVIGALYLENQLTINAFTAERLGVINLLLAQAAISFENAQLFDEVTQLNENLERKVEQRTQELNVAVNELKEANKGLETFSHSVSHDLRAPLRRMSMFSEVIMEDYGDQLNEDVTVMLGKINQASHQMGELISGLLSLSRIQRQVVELEAIDLSDMVDELFIEMRERNPKSRVETFHEDNCNVMADKRILRSIMENLISNAWKYSSKKAQPQVTFGRIPREEGIPEGIGEVPNSVHPTHSIFFVRDNGAGFDMDKAQELFGTFKRLHSPKDFEGTGIGLSTVKRAIEKHGGTVWANAAEGEGATFYFTLQNARNDQY